MAFKLLGKHGAPFSSLRAPVYARRSVLVRGVEPSDARGSVSALHLCAHHLDLEVLMAKTVVVDSFSLNKANIFCNEKMSSPKLFFFQFFVSNTVRSSLLFYSPPVPFEDQVDLL